MAGRRVKRSVSDRVETVVPSAAKATKSAPHRKIVCLGAFGALLVIAAVPILSPGDMPVEAANGTLKCLDKFGNYEPCVTQASASPASASPAPLDGRTTAAQQPASRTATAPYQPANWTAPAPSQSARWTAPAPSQPASWTATVPYQPTNWAATAPSQQANWTTVAVDQPANAATTAPAAPRSAASAKRLAAAACRRRLIPCLFSSLRKKLTHIASAVALAGQPRPAKEPAKEPL